MLGVDEWDEEFNIEVKFENVNASTHGVEIIEHFCMSV